MGSVVLHCLETTIGLPLLRNACPGAFTGIQKSVGREGVVCLLNLPINVHKCLIILKNTQLEYNCDANLSSCMDLVMKQNPLPFQKVQWKKYRSCCETVD